LIAIFIPVAEFFLYVWNYRGIAVGGQKAKGILMRIFRQIFPDSWKFQKYGRKIEVRNLSGESIDCLPTSLVLSYKI
jgi:hypothetical protein